MHFPEVMYVGYTTDLKTRLKAHNAGDSEYTSAFKPWRMVWHCSFMTKSKALEFEKYLKSHSGKAFMHKRLL